MQFHCCFLLCFSLVGSECLIDYLTSCLHDFPYNNELMLFLLAVRFDLICAYGEGAVQGRLICLRGSCEPIVLTVRSGIWVTGLFATLFCSICFGHFVYGEVCDLTIEFDLTK